MVELRTWSKVGFASLRPSRAARTRPSRCNPRHFKQTELRAALEWIYSIYSIYCIYGIHTVYQYMHMHHPSHYPGCFNAEMCCTVTARAYRASHYSGSCPSTIYIFSIALRVQHFLCSSTCTLMNCAGAP